MEEMNFERLGKQFEELHTEGAQIDAKKVEGRWLLRGGTEDQQRRFRRLSATGARLCGFVGSDDEAMGYWLNRVVKSARDG